ncbi:MAG: ABC transporter permease subunit [Anaerolineae bacterium]|nr:ABC transporter permease subunit [Anaerolineae bacterium]
MTAVEQGARAGAGVRSGRLGRFNPLAILHNPVAVKELRGRMRGPRAFLVLTAYLALMSGFTLLLYMLAASARDIYGFTSGGQIGRTLFTGIVGIELFLVTFIVPAFTAGAISGERERQTFDLLRTTLLPAQALVVGKLVSALAYVVLLLIAAIPLQSIAFLFGGVTEMEVILATLILLVTSVAQGALGVYLSAARSRTVAASVASYGVTMGLTIGMPLLVLGLVALVGPRLNTLTPGAQAVLTYALLFLAATNPLSTAFTTQAWLLETGSAGLIAHQLSSPVGSPVQSIVLVSPWIIFTVLYLVATIYLVRRAVRRVRRLDVA